MSSVIKHTIGYIICYGVTFIVVMKAIAWSWPIPGGDVTREGADLMLANIGSTIVGVAAIPFTSTMSFFGKAFWFFVTAFWAAVVYPFFVLVCMLLKYGKSRTGRCT